MEAIIKYKLPDEMNEYLLAINASKYFSALWSMDQWLRQEIRRNPDLHPDEKEIYELIRKKLNEIIEDNNIIMDEIS